MKVTHSKTAQRRSHHRAVSVHAVATPSGGVRRRHFADPKTGMYRGKQIFTPVVANTKKTK
jgi:ribosomal protein L32